MSSETDKHIKMILSILPDKPGCYQYFDDKGTIIYVGKAKNLKRRVSSYFNKEHESNKTRVLVKQIRDIKYIVVDTEEDALLLENNLIKQYRPRYNVMLKDDKTYPSIVVKNEYFPRIFQTRNIVRDGSQYYGPYPSVYTAKVMLQMLKELYPLRTCKLPLTPELIAEGKYSVCLEYHIKRCKGPCVGLQSLDEYRQNISEIKEILRGNISQISKHLYEEMQVLAGELKFEEAQKIKEKYEVIENYRSKSTVVTPMLHNIDVFSIAENERSAYINFMHIGNGAIVQAYTFEYKKRLDETKEELLSLGIIEMRERFKSTVRGTPIERRASHILVSDKPDGPYIPMKDPTYLPADKPTLDGTFWVDKDGKPYMIYCYEWLQNWNGTIEKIELKPDLSGSVGEGKLLFRASDSPWSREKDENGKIGPHKVTDGPYLFTTGTGRLGMIWTSWIYDVYVQGVAYSESGTLDGPWIQEKEIITPENFGHGMLFQTLEGKWLMSVHSHENRNGHYHRIPHLFEVDLSGDKLVVGKPYK